MEERGNKMKGKEKTVRVIKREGSCSFPTTVFISSPCVCLRFQKQQLMYAAKLLLAQYLEFGQYDYFRCPELDLQLAFIGTAPLKP